MNTKLLSFVLFLVSAVWIVAGLTAVYWIHSAGQHQLGNANTDSLLVVAPRNTSTTVGAVGAQLVPARSDRSCFRATNLSTSTVFVSLGSTSTANAGIVLAPFGQLNSVSSTFPGSNVWDMGASHVLWTGYISMVSNTTGSIVAFIECGN